MPPKKLSEIGKANEKLFLAQKASGSPRCNICGRQGVRVVPVGYMPGRRRWLCLECQHESLTTHK